MSKDNSSQDATNIVASSTESENSIDEPSLSEMSERDKDWDKHRRNADTVANYYRGDEDFRDYAQRMDFCSQFLQFRLVPDNDEGLLKLKLSNARFCRVRHCPVCQARRSMQWKARAFEALPRVVADFPKHRWLFLTLTIKNVPVTELRETLKWMNESFVRLTKLKEWNVDGWIKSVEVTRGRDGNAHPHFHVLLMVPPSYFGRNYISQLEWVELWKKSARLDYKPQVHVKAISKKLNPTVIVPEILKYQVKESDLIADKGFFLELTRQLHKTRAVSVGGVLRDYMRKVGEEPENLIGKDDEDEDTPDEGILTFTWRYHEKRYRMSNFFYKQSTQNLNEVSADCFDTS